MAGGDGSDVVEEAVRRHVDSTGDPGFSRQELIERLAKTIPEAVDTLTPDGNMPTDEQLRQRLMPAA